MPSTNYEGNEQLIHFSNQKAKDAYILCRLPRCDAKFSSKQARAYHEKKSHPKTSYCCQLCGIVAGQKQAIDKHRLRFHVGLDANKHEQFVN